MSTVMRRPQPLITLGHRGRSASSQPISSLMSLALANPATISLAAGFVDNATLPVEELGTISGELFADPRAAREALQYGTVVGDEDLRRGIAHRYFAVQPERHAERMILTAGSNQFLQLASECLLDPGDIVLCASPTYFVYLNILRDLGARARGVGTDAEGMIPDELEGALRHLATAGELARVKAVYLVPDFDNPAATTMSLERRKQILQVLENWRDRATILLIVDNAYRELRFEGEDIPSLSDLGADPERTVESGTFSKNLAPGLRVGWGVTPEPLYTAMTRRKGIIDFGSPHLNQRLVAGILNSGMLDEHLRRLREAYRAKRDAMIAACDEYLRPIAGVAYDVPAGGLYVWLTLPEGCAAGPDGELWKQALDKGVLYVPGQYCYPEEGDRVATNTARLTFGVQPPERLREGIRLLAEAIRTSGTRGNPEP
ncbi:aminotransferase-like domain-containing protein [Candidatus Laterigemmans baculatus]|uniref:aminotransferase-like domain-containing protein n=1 Tax=Candidatus Laterigemmans baculatus TaxID=2770505 RepID=UPI0013D9761E|nr:PLP-dependent aminotransferase family protein [Candidatus Laterigemmans baculatus]